MSEIFWRASFRRNHIAPYLFETLLDGRHIECREGSLVEPLHDRLRRRGGKKECIPARNIKVSQPLLMCRRQIRQDRRSLFAQNRNCLHGLARNLRQGKGQAQAVVIHPTSHDVLHPLHHVAVGDVRDLDADRGVEQHAGEMIGAAHA